MLQISVIRPILKKQDFFKHCIQGKNLGHKHEYMTKPIITG